MIGTLAAAAVVLSACGSTGGRSAAELRPASPVTLSVYINGSRVSVSPTSVGAGPVVFVATNQAPHAESLVISRGSQSAASTAPINPQGTTQVTVNLTRGSYSVATGTQGQSDAQLSEGSSIAPATIHVGAPRASSSNQVLQP